MERILIAQTAFLGDAVLSAPVIGALAKLFPGAELSLLTTPLAAPLFEGDERLHRVIAFEKRSKDRGLMGLYRVARLLRGHRYTRAYALQGSIRTALLFLLAGVPQRIGWSGRLGSWLYSERVPPRVGGHAVERHLALVYGSTPRELWFDRISLPQPDLLLLSEPVRAFLDSGQRYVVMTPGSAWETKQWDVKSYAGLARQLVDSGFKVVVAGAPHEQHLARQIVAAAPVLNLCGVGSVRDLAALIHSAAALVCNDSAPLHIASAYGVPTVALFCSTLPEFGFTPWGTNSVVLDATGLPCKPCGRHGRRRCPLGTNACMTQVQPETVLAAVKTVQR